MSPVARSPFDPDSFAKRVVAAGPSVFRRHGDPDRVGPLLEEAQGLDPGDRARLVVTLFREADSLAEQISQLRKDRKAFIAKGSRFIGHRTDLVDVATKLLKRKLSFAPQDLVSLLKGMAGERGDRVHASLHVSGTVRHIETHWDRYSDNPDIARYLARIAEGARIVARTSELKLAARIDGLLNTGAQIPLERGEAWTDAAMSDIETMNATERDAWAVLLQHCQSASSSKPSGKWSKSAAAMCESIGRENLQIRLSSWFELVDRPRTRRMTDVNWRTEGAVDELIAEPNAETLRGLCWIAGMSESVVMARALGAVAVSCYRKVPGIGPRAVKVGNAAVYALGQMPGRASLGQLAMLCVKVKFGTAQKLMEKALDAAATREGLPRDEIEEMAVPSYGLTEVGELRGAMGDCSALLEIRGTAGASSTRLTWINDRGGAVKSAPATVKRDFADELKELKASMKDIQKMLPAQRDRIDSLFLDRRTWAYDTWRERYLDHPLIGTLARRLIWLFDDGREQVAAAWLADDAEVAPHGAGRLVRDDGTAFEPRANSSTVRLWHPISQDAAPGSTETRDDIEAWRAFYESREIRQPFKQAHREVYLLTDAERNTGVYSNRFAAHVIRQHQFHALAAQRSWRNRLRLMVDDSYPPAHRTLNAWNLRAEFWIEGIGDDYRDEYVLDSGAFRYLATDQVRFYEVGAAINASHAFGGGYETMGPDEAGNHPLRIDQIPPIVLSEILRDVDLFVGVASVGANPEWQDGGPDGVFRDYWQSYSFGELSGSAQSRREILRRLIPRLKIADACTITDRFLVVLGRRRTYRIHFGSGNILMEPNDQYLCIVPNSSMERAADGGKLFLPFEGDRTLAIILSKAFMLVEDDRIKDKTIVSQINRRV